MNKILLDLIIQECELHGIALENLVMNCNLPFRISPNGTVYTIDTNSYTIEDPRTTEFLKTFLGCLYWFGFPNDYIYEE